MAKKFVRGITDVKTINNQDFDTNNVNDLLSDGEHNYIHRKKKDKSEEYHNLTNNIKTIKSDNTDLLTVKNNNNTTNSATLSPKHDKLKEQVIESTRNTIDIEYGENGTEETTKVDTNPQKVLEHDNLITNENSVITITHEPSSETTNISLSPDFVNDVENLKTDAIINITSDTPLIEFTKDGSNVELNGTGLVNIINAKQNKLTAGSGITIQGSTISATTPTPTPKQITGVNRGNYYIYATIDEVQPLDVFGDESIVITKILNVFVAIPETEEITTYSATLQDLGLSSSDFAYTVNTTPVVNNVTIDVRDSTITLTASNSAYVEFKVLIYQ